MTQNAKVKWGILSTSSTAVGKAIPALKRCANADISAIASRDLGTAERVAISSGIPKAYGSYEALVEDPEVEVVYVPLPNALHSEWTVRAARAGKHILCEKPAALSPEAAHDMIEACGSNNVLFMEGFMYRFHPQFDCVKLWLAEGRIGGLRLLRVSFSFILEARHSRIRLQRSLGGGAVADVGAYGIDLSRWLIGSEPTRVFASGSRGLGADVETSFTAILEYPGGVNVLLDGAFDRPRHNRCEIVGQSGDIVISSPFIPAAAGVRLQATSGEDERIFPLVDPFQLQFQHFSACVLGRTVPAISINDTIGNAHIVAALRTSLDTRSPVDIVASVSLKGWVATTNMSKDTQHHE